MCSQRWLPLTHIPEGRSLLPGVTVPTGQGKAAGHTAEEGRNNVRKEGGGDVL